MPNDDRAYVPWVIVGGGRAGQAIAQLGLKVGADVRALWNRSPIPNIEHIPTFSGELFEIGDLLGGSVVWITVADDAIESVAREVATYLKPADIVLHCSGSLTCDVLRSASVVGPVASLHPLLSISDPKTAVDRFSECAWTVEGDFPALAFAKWMLGRIGVEPHEIQSDAKVMYHASAVTAAGLLDALMDAAFTMSEVAGFSREQAKEMLIPLAESTLHNLKSQSTAEALTGPSARNDKATINAHLAALESHPEELGIYRVLTNRAERIASDLDD